jgi:hypothetical protein
MNIDATIEFISQMETFQIVINSCQSNCYGLKTFD